MRRAIWLAALVVACGDEDADDDTKLAELTAEQLGEVCGRVDARYARFEKAFVSASCTQMGIMTPSTCEATRSACIQNTNPVGALEGMVMFQCQGSPEAVVSTCAQITVGELDACTEAIIDGVESLASMISCTADLDMLMRPERPDACTKLGDRCPSFASFEL